MDLKTLQYWHKLEHFYPYLLTEQISNSVKTYHINTSASFPNLDAIPLEPDREVACISVYLGIFKIDSALKVIDERLHHTPKFKDESGDESCFCCFRLSPDGWFDRKSFKVSTFPWAVQRVKENKIDLDHWEEDFNCFYQEMLSSLLNSEQPLDYHFFKSFRDQVSATLRWGIAFSHDWMRIDIMTREKQETNGTQEAQDAVLEVEELIKVNDLLNSFYIRDLEKVIADCKENGMNSNTALSQFLEMQNSRRIDVEKNETKLFELFNPKLQPMVRWPSNYSLRAMQQAAVNVFLSEELLEKKIFSVNGPPGTGKTTLLKDIIAGVVFERAKALSELEAPDDAFEEEASSVSYQNNSGNSYRNKIKTLKKAFSQHGILVASNNNSAVKNITVELPDIKAIPHKYQRSYNYFKRVSDYVLDKNTWGMTAAALGNKKNCKDFVDKFWPLVKKEDPNPPFDFNAHLRKLNKTPLNEKADNWKTAVSRFEKALKDVEEAQKDAHRIYQTLVKERELREQLSSLAKSCIEIEKDLLTVREEERSKKEALQTLHKLLDECRGQLVSFEKEKPLLKWTKVLGLFYKSASFREYTALKTRHENCLEMFGEVESSLEKIKVETERLERDASEKRAQIDACEESIKIQEDKIANFQVEHPSNKRRFESSTLPSSAYLAGLISDDGERRAAHQKSVPWNIETLDTLREVLFFESMRLHEAFVENSNQMRENLDAFNKMLRGILSPKDLENHADTLLQSFFLVVPVVSTTFASIGKFLEHIGKGSVGYLLIDEAGQALPQTAVGAIWRSKKVIAVGDPLQIDPVVTLHDKVIDYLKHYYNQSDSIANKETSVQSLADCCNAYGSYRKVSGSETFWVGSPLLVHGRCRKHIFDISNTIAYNEKMIYDTQDGGSEATCKWIDAKGLAETGHYVPAHSKAIEALVVEAFMQTYQKSGPNTLPDLFIITPFRSVRAGVNRYFKKENYLLRRLHEKGVSISKSMVSRWLRTNIGTIHTFQGKEAERVIICLGGDSSGKSAGAINWASSKPNLLNVAVTRAKHALYIVGDVECWKNQNFFATAYQKCREIEQHAI